MHVCGNICCVKNITQNPNIGQNPIADLPLYKENLTSLGIKLLLTNKVLVVCITECLIT